MLAERALDLDIVRLSASSLSAKNQTNSSGAIVPLHVGTTPRAEEIDAMASTRTSYFAFAGSDLGYQYNATSGKASSYIYRGGRILFRVDSGTSATYHYYLEDLSNNVRVVWSYTTSVVVEGKFRYKPFGELATPLVTPSSDPRFRYAEQSYSSPTKLYAMGARSYAPDLGRFVSRDPVGGHGYAYAADNPVSFWDPSGKDVWPTLVNWWNGLDPNVRTIITFGALAVLTIATGGLVSSALATYMIAGGIVAGVISAGTYAVTNPGATPTGVLAAFTEGFFIGAASTGFAVEAPAISETFAQSAGEELSLEADVTKIAGQAAKGLIKYAGPIDIATGSDILKAWTQGRPVNYAEMVWDFAGAAVGAKVSDWVAPLGEGQGMPDFVTYLKNTYVGEVAGAGATVGYAYSSTLFSPRPATLVESRGDGGEQQMTQQAACTPDDYLTLNVGFAGGYPY